MNLRIIVTTTHMVDKLEKDSHRKIYKWLSFSNLSTMWVVVTIILKLKILRKCRKKIDCQICKALFIRELKPTLNKQSNSFIVNRLRNISASTIQYTQKSLCQVGLNTIVYYYILYIIILYIILCKYVCIDTYLKYYIIYAEVSKWFQLYFTNRKQRILTKDVLSNDLDVKYGVPQGSCAGPLIFLSHLLSLYDLIVQYDGNLRGFADDNQLYISFKPNTESEASAFNEIINCIATGLQLQLQSKS